MDKIELPSHAFISYSSRDADIVTKIVARCREANINIWWDQKLVPGTPNYDRAIRAAIEDAWAVVYVVSPNSRDSAFVYSEVQTAKENNLPIIPVWIDGEKWIASVIPDMSLAQYVDCREDLDANISSAVSQLLSLQSVALPKVIRIPQGTHLPLNLTKYYTVVVHGERRVGVWLDAMSNVLELVDSIYKELLFETHQPAYGANWLLGWEIDLPGSFEIIAPWTWMYDGNSSYAIAEYDFEWFKRKLALNVHRKTILIYKELQIIDLTRHVNAGGYLALGLCSTHGELLDELRFELYKSPRSGYRIYWGILGVLGYAEDLWPQQMGKLISVAKVAASQVSTEQLIDHAIFLFEKNRFHRNEPLSEVINIENQSSMQRLSAFLTYASRGDDGEE
jgi:hypothetical protein